MRMVSFIENAMSSGLSWFLVGAIVTCRDCMSRMCPKLLDIAV